MVWDHIIACMQMERLSFWHCTASVATTCYIIGSTCAHPLWFESGMALAALPQAEERGHGAPMTLTGDIDKSFERWLEESKVKAPKCVARSREHGRKVEARVAIRAGEVVVHVPDSAVFTAQVTRVTPRRHRVPVHLHATEALQTASLACGLRTPAYTAAWSRRASPMRRGPAGERWASRPP